MPALGLYLGLSNRTVFGGLDADALAYIALAEAAGATITGAQKTTISDFYVAAKAEGYYTSLKRLYLPIWGVAAANAIDMITGASGTFNGGVTHGAGFVQGDGATGYFDFGVSPDTLGLTALGNMIGALIHTAPSADSRTFVSGCSAVNTANDFRLDSTFGNPRTRNFSGTNATVVAGGLSNIKGILTSTRENATDVRCSIRKTAGVTDGVTQSLGGGGSSAVNLTAMALNTAGVYSAFSNASLGSYFAADGGFNFADVNNFTLHLKTLWESTTGLSLA